jgi:hypothetical protein
MPDCFLYIEICILFMLTKYSLAFKIIDEMNLTLNVKGRNRKSDSDNWTRKPIITQYILTNDILKTYFYVETMRYLGIDAYGSRLTKCECLHKDKLP